MSRRIAARVCRAGSHMHSVLALGALLATAAAVNPVLGQTGSGKASPGRPAIASTDRALPSGAASAAIAQGLVPITSAERVSIRVPEHPVLSGEYRINDDETISFPVVGRIKVSGRTGAELEVEIAEEVRKRVGREVHVTLEVVDYRPVFVNGYVARAGAMPWKPGYTVMHAESLAGGIFRPTDNRSGLPAETERARASRAAADLARLLAHLARVQAERADEARPTMPKEMGDLVNKSEAAKLMAAQTTMMASRKSAFEARIKSLERAKTVSEEEIKALKEQMGRLDEQIGLRQSLSNQMKSLNAKGLMRIDRTLDEQSRIAELEERRTNVIVGLARVHSTLSQVVRELDVVRQERIAALDEEIIRIEREAAQQKIEVDSAVSSFRQLTGQNLLVKPDQRTPSSLSYEILRNEGNQVKTIKAHPLTPLLPGDLLMIRLQDQAS